MYQIHNLFSEIRVVLEIIPNHTGKKHPWFEASRSQGNTGEYADYYVWHPGKQNEDGSTIPPSNWVRYFMQRIDGQTDLNKKKTLKKEINAS